MPNQISATKTAKKRVCLIIIAFNEAPTIGGLIKTLNELFARSSFHYKIVVIDDNSTDSTAKIAESAGAHVLSHLINTGSGGATATGLSYARQKGFDITATIDGDGQHEPRDVVKGVQLFMRGDNDLLIGSRLIDSKGMSTIKLIGNRGLSFITFLLFGISVTDSQSGLRFFSKKALENLKWKSHGYEFASEMLWRAKQQGLRIEEYPVRAIYTDYSKSKGQNNWNAFNIIRSLLKRRFMEFFGE